MKVRNNKLLDWIGAACGVFLVLVLLGNIVSGAMTAKAEADALKASGIGTVLTAAESSPLKVETAPKLVATGSGIQLLTAADWAEEYPAIYESYMKNSENTEVQDYVATHPDDEFTFMINEIYHDDSETGWNEYEKLVRTFNQRIYLMPDNLPHELGIQVTPTVISADNERYVLVLEELGKISLKQPDNGAVERRYQYE